MQSTFLHGPSRPPWHSSETSAGLASRSRGSWSSTMVTCSPYGTVPYRPATSHRLSTGHPEGGGPPPDGETGMGDGLEGPSWTPVSRHDELADPHEPTDRGDSSIVNGGRFLKSGDEAGTAPEDRAFRPDVEGLRAVAVTLVFLYHFGVRPLVGGYVGVDVFFVISGFVITGLLLRERTFTGKTGILGFYGRRARRIIPVATFVIVVASIGLVVLSGVSVARESATNARWTALFLGNIRHDILLGPYWSLAIEEQFYLVYPVLFLVVATVGRRRSLRARLGVFLTVVVVASFWWSLASSPGSPAAASSTFTRAWELAVGGLLAVCASPLKKMPATLAASVTWAGLVGLMIIAFSLKYTYFAAANTAAALPVLATALIILGGTAAPRNGAETLLRRAPFKWIGRWSFSIYLWHWPIFILVVARWHPATSLVYIPLGALVLIVSAGSYFAIENPIRHSQLLNRSPLASIGTGLVLIAGCLAAITLLAGG
jgi:peptidoglycan/LPS O-acetylase OafA/YrhL